MRIFKSESSAAQGAPDTASGVPADNTSPAALSTEGQAFGQTRGQARVENFFLGGRDVVIQPAQLDGAFVHVVDDVGGFGIVVARLADAPDVDEILAARLEDRKSTRLNSSHSQ